VDNNIRKLEDMMYINAIKILTIASKSGKKVIDRELSPFASFIDYYENKRNNNIIELRNSEKYIGRKIEEFK
jgi:hypothetical protein